MTDIPEDIDDILEAREKAVALTRKSNDPLCGLLAQLELMASPYFLGVDGDTDDSDLGVWP